MARLVKRRIKFREEDARLIIDCYLNPPVHPVDHNIYKCHKSYYAPHSEDARPLYPTTNKEILKKSLRRFIEDYFPDDLKKQFLNENSSFVLHHCTDLLLHHKCDNGDTCKKHLTLIMKLRIMARTSTSRDLIHRDIIIFIYKKISTKLMAIYFMKFILRLDLMSVFFQENFKDVDEFLTQSADYIMPYFATEFDPCTHYCVARRFVHLFELFIKHGARNLDIHQHPHYKSYTKRDFFDEHILKDFMAGFIFFEPNFIIDSRIKMRVLQVFIWSRFGIKAMQKLTMSHIEPYITRQEYEATFNGFATPPEITAEIKANLLRESWNSYKSIFKIEDNAQVTPRSLQDVCRYFIRLNLESNGKLPDGVKLLWDEKGGNPFLESYLTSEDKKNVQSEAKKDVQSEEDVQKVEEVTHEMSNLSLNIIYLY